jgi:hypothetical protein
MQGNGLREWSIELWDYASRIAIVTVRLDSRSSGRPRPNISAIVQMALALNMR